MGKSEDKYYNDSTWNVVYVNSHDYSPDSNYIPTYSDSQWCEDFDLMFTFRGIPCMAFVKRYTSGSIDSVAAVAISSSYNFTGLPDGTYVDVVSGATKVVSGGTLSVSGLSQAKMAVYVLQNASSGTLSKIGGSTTYLA